MMKVMALSDSRKSFDVILFCGMEREYVCGEREGLSRWDEFSLCE